MRSNKWIHLFWCLGAIAIISFYTWGGRLYIDKPVFFLTISAYLLLSNIIHADRPSKIGLWPDNFGQCFKERGGQLIGLALILIWFGTFFGNFSTMGKNGGIWFLIKCLASGLAQQYALNGFFVNRLIGFSGNQSEGRIPILAAIAFSFLHLPNPFLVVTTGIFGYLCVKIFLEHRNLYFLGLAHGLISFIIFHTFPKWITSSFAIGSKFFAQ